MRTATRLVLLSLALSTGAAVSAAAAEEGKTVLVVHGEDPYLPWVTEVSSGVFELLESMPEPLRPDIYVEYLDLARFPVVGRYEARVAWLRQKYREKRPDAIVVVTLAGLDFFRPIARELWPDVPIVFIEDAGAVRGVALPPGILPVLARFEVAETIDLAKSVLPGTRRVAFVTGAPDIEGGETDYFERDFQARGDGLELIDLSGLPMAELRKRVGSLPEDTVVFYWGIRLDGAGRAFVPREALQQFAPVSNRPIFSVFTTMMGYGLTGGRLFDFRDLGREGGRTVRRILEGEAPASLAPPHRGFSRVAFDARELERFHVPAGRLPAGSDVQFRELGLVQRYPHATAAVVAALVIQAGLIVGLLFERRRRHEAEDESRQRRWELAHAGRLTAVGELTASISHEINQPLGAILANAEAAEMLLAGGGDVEEVRRILADIRRDDLRASEVVRRVRGLAGKGAVELKPVDPNDAVTSVIRLLEYEARRHDVAIEAKLTPGLWLPRCDEVSLQQVLINLALNGMEAMANAPPGTRRLRLATGAGDDRVEFRVSDSGPGISDAARARLFQSFFTTKTHGVGLGLSICRSIVDGLGGSIGAENNPAGGATFWFSLPLEEVRSAGSRSAAAGYAS